ncbi:MAG: domain containing protein [Frankiales bacterium]|nr:domain containing protein [Frankiales bacterium]
MARWTGTWLQGPGVTLGELRNPGTWPGSRLGLPQTGSGSVAPFGVRAFGFALDIVASALAAGIVSAQLDHPSDLTRQLIPYGVLLLEQVILVALTGQSLGMRVMGIKVVRLSDVSRPPGFLAALARALPLLLSAGLAGFFTRDGRGVHDLIAGCVVLRD